MGDAGHVSTVGRPRNGHGYLKTMHKAPSRGPQPVSAQSSQKQVVYSRDWTSVGGHTIAVRVGGTPGHPKVDVDAFLVLQSAIDLMLARFQERRFSQTDAANLGAKVAACGQATCRRVMGLPGWSRMTA